MTDYHKAYEEHTKSLRGWLGGFGVGALALILSQESVRKSLKDTNNLGEVAWAMIIGVCSQALLVWLNKVLMWNMANAEVQLKHAADEKREYTPRDYRGYRTVEFLSERFEIDVLLDVTTLASYCYGTYRMFEVLTR